MRPSRGNRSKLKKVLLGCVEPSRTLSPTSTKIGSPMLPIIERFGSGPAAQDHKGVLYHVWSVLSRTKNRRARRSAGGDSGRRAREGWPLYGRSAFHARPCLEHGFAHSMANRL